MPRRSGIRGEYSYATEYCLPTTRNSLTPDISTQQVWSQMRDRLLAFIKRRVRDADTAEDLLQESFVHIHTGLDRIDDADRWMAWVYRIVRNTIADYYRRHSNAASDGSATESIAAVSDPQWNQLVGDWLIAMISRLPDRYREVLELSEIDGLRHRDIAKRLGLSLSATKSRVQRGRHLLREGLLACCEVDFDTRGNVVDVVTRRSCPVCGCDDARDPC